MGGRIYVVTLYLRTGAKDEEPNRQLIAHTGYFFTAAPVRWWSEVTYR